MLGLNIGDKYDALLLQAEVKDNICTLNRRAI